MSEQEMATLAVETANATDERQNILDLLRLSTAQVDALSAKFAKLPKLQKAEVRKLEGFNTEVETYCAYVLAKMANDYLNAQMRDIWIQRLEMLIPRILTKDEKLRSRLRRQWRRLHLRLRTRTNGRTSRRFCRKTCSRRAAISLRCCNALNGRRNSFTSVWKK
jgi:hypothetical protein